MTSIPNEQQLRDELPDRPQDWKIFPRNLTARAAPIVLGNPVTTRPEDGVDNCYPGLEMDARNIQKYFFPGLYIDVYRDHGARLAEVLDDRWQSVGIKPGDADQNLYVWAMKGRVKGDQDPNDPPTITFVEKDPNKAKMGLDVWRKASDLFRGPVGIVLGSSLVAPPDLLGKAVAELDEAFRSGPGGRVFEDEGRVVGAVLVDHRTDYLDENGVLDPDIYQPGEFTRTLCTPWTYDFRDCQCFYWASNKPDVVSSEDGQYEYLNFQRKNRFIEPQTEDIAYSYQGRRSQEIDYAEMMTDWQQLRPVLSGRELTEAPEPDPSGEVMPLDRLRAEVEYLATVEHALAVQYLYAYYSIDAPTGPQPPTEDRPFALWSAAQEVFQIAIDEMRHFMWANQTVALLGGNTTADRATMLGRRLQVPFYLQSLSSPQLQWFIDVERPSASIREGLDGMYIGALRSIMALSDDQVSPEIRRRAVELVKLIIDEGEEHYRRFSSAQQNLAFYDDAGRGAMPLYLRSGQWQMQSTRSDVPVSPLFGAPAGTGDPNLGYQQTRSDSLYAALLGLLKIAFAFGSVEASGNALRSAISVMFRLNEVNLDLAANGCTPLFTLPEGFAQDPPPTTFAQAMETLENVRELLAGEPDDVGARLSIVAPPHELPLSEVLDTFREQIRRVHG